MAYRAVGAAVVRLAAFDELSPDAMQRIAAELNAPATAFIAPAEAVSCEPTATLPFPSQFLIHI